VRSFGGVGSKFEPRKVKLSKHHFRPKLWYVYTCCILMGCIRVCTSWYLKLEPTGRFFLENLRNTLITCLPPSMLLLHLTIYRAALLKGLLKPKKKKGCASRYVYVFGKLSQVRSEVFDQDCNNKITADCQGNEECIASRFKDLRNVTSL
jgi:hypothetical protein